MTPEQREELRQAAMKLVDTDNSNESISAKEYTAISDAFYKLATPEATLSLIAQVEALTTDNRVCGMDAEAARLLRSSVPDHWKDCTSPIGAVQSYIAELEEKLEALTVPQPVGEPNQPVILDDKGTQRFRANALVQHLLDNNGGAHIGLNELHEIDCSNADREQFSQLIGYSVSGWGTLSYVSDERWDAVQAMIDAAPTIPAIPGTKEGA